MTKASDHQEGGTHYKDMGDFQPWDVLQHWLTPEEYRGYQKGVAIAYLARERSKGGDQDIKKAAHHLQRLIEAFEPPATVADLANDLRSIGITTCSAVHDDSKSDGCGVVACCGQHATCSKPCVPREQQRAGPDGWITWAGGECPVPKRTQVRYRLRNGPGGTFNDFTSRADLLVWQHGLEDCDIIAYRLDA